MLSLAVTIPLKRRTVKERLFLCKKEKIVKESNQGFYGSIDVNKIYHFSRRPFFTPKRLEKALKTSLYTPSSPIPKEYLRRAVLLRLIERLKKEKGKTVFLSEEFIINDILGEICRYSKKVYIMKDSLPDYAEEIYKKYGTLPFCVSCPVTADYCPSIKECITVSLPEKLYEIYPKEFSPLLIAALIYKENGIMIV